ncbi:MAG: PEP-CTERM sorting domain-containing protein [Methyloprofundus sp.]|nr:PEP-CTERM sorting domain-containing protein [Methyloprofundus sp.]
MQINFKKHALVAVTLGALSIGTAQALVIDNFDSGLVSFSATVAESSADSQSGTMLGGIRAIEIGVIEGTGSTAVTVADGVLDINNGTTERSLVIVSYSFGFGVDFTGSGFNTGLFLTLPNPINNAMGLALKLSDGGNFLTSKISFPTGFSGDFFLPFTDLTGVADLSSIASVRLDITSESNGLGVQIGDFEVLPAPPVRPKNPTSVPEPADILLMGLGFAGLGAMRRKRA